MKTTKTKTLAILVLALGLMVCPAELAGAATIGTAFTYQGRLVDDNSVANGVYDFQFKVFDRVILGNQQGSTIYIYGLNVIDGNFTVELDFGSGIFYGDARWLEIGVRPGGSTDSFTILSPLQEVKPTPNSIHATHALQADEADTLNGFDSTAFASVAHSHDGVYALISHTHDGSDITEGTVADVRIAASIARDSEITWGNLADIPAGFADGIDDIGGTDSVWTISGNDIYSGVAGNVGIGTSNPLSKLSVGGVGIANTGVYGSGSSFGVVGDSTGYGVRGSGNFGVYGVGTNAGVYGKNSDTLAWGRLGYGDHGVHGVSTSIGVYGVSSGSGGARCGGYFTATGNFGRGIYAKGGPSGYAAECWGNVIIKNQGGDTTLMELGEGLDYAEGFDVSESTKIDAGSVLIIDADNPGKLALSTKPYDSKVAGIAAGAKGMGSGVRLGSDEFDCDVALAGRVYCNVDATEAPVEPGDLLTTSTTPGYAMKAADYMRAQGAILGKAMEKLEKGKKGQILVLVTLQ